MQELEGEQSLLLLFTAPQARFAPFSHGWGATRPQTQQALPAAWSNGSSRYPFRSGAMAERPVSWNSMLRPHRCACQTSHGLLPSALQDAQPAWPLPLSD